MKTTKADLASLYRDKYRIGHPSQIDIEAIAYEMGIMVTYESLRGCEAFIVGMGDKAHAVISRESYPARQRFSIAHEIGHWFQDRGKVGNLCTKADIKSNTSSHSSRKAKPGEKVANNFAAELLMPEYLCIPYFRANMSVEALFEFRDAFSVSLTAAAIRLASHSDYPVLVSCYQPKGDRRWFTRSKYVTDWVFPLRRLTVDKLPSSSTPIVADADEYLEYKGCENDAVRVFSWQTSLGELLIFIELLSFSGDDSYS